MIVFIGVYMSLKESREILIKFYNVTARLRIGHIRRTFKFKMLDDFIEKWGKQ